MTIAPLNIYENQVLPVGLHNLSKSFRPNLSTIRVLSRGAKFIPKWKFKKVFLLDYADNKVFFPETRPGVFKGTLGLKLNPTLSQTFNTTK